MDKYIVLEGSKYTLYPSTASLQAYLATKPQSWVFRSSSDYPRRSVAAATSKAIKAGSSVIISLRGGIVTPRYQAAQVGRWVI